jgi:hypothetical protein
LGHGQDSHIQWIKRDSETILSTIPLVELLECVEVLREVVLTDNIAIEAVRKLGIQPTSTITDKCIGALAAIDAKLKP